MKKISNLVTIFASIFLFSAPLAAGEPPPRAALEVHEPEVVVLAELAVDLPDRHERLAGRAQGERAVRVHDRGAAEVLPVERHAPGRGSLLVITSGGVKFA